MPREVKFERALAQDTLLRRASPKQFLAQRLRLLLSLAHERTQHQITRESDRCRALLSGRAMECRRQKPSRDNVRRDRSAEETMGQNYQASRSLGQGRTMCA